MKFIFRSRFSWADFFIIVSTPFLVNAIGWWAILVVLVGFVLSAVTSAMLGVL